MPHQSSHVPLYLHVFGGLRLEGAPTVPQDVNQLAWIVLTYVMMHDSPVLRQQLTDDILPESYRGDRVIWNALQSLQAWLGEDVLVVDRRTVRIAQGIAYCTDATVFQHLLTGDDDVVQVQMAIGLYARTPFVDSKYPWVNTLDLRLHERYCRALQMVYAHAESHRKHAWRLHYGRMLAEALLDDVEVQLQYWDLLLQMRMEELIVPHLRSLERPVRKAVEQAFSQMALSPVAYYLHEENNALMDRRLQLYDVPPPSYLHVATALMQLCLQTPTTRTFGATVQLPSDRFSLQMMRSCVCSLLQSVLHYVVLTVEDDAQGPNNALWMVLQALRRDAVLLAKCKAIIRTVPVGSAFYDALIDLIERNRPTAQLDETHQQAFIQVLSTLHKQTPIAVLFVGNDEQYQADVARLSHVLPLRWVLIGDTSTSVEAWQTFTPAPHIAIDCEFWVALTFARRQLHGDILRDMIGHVHSVMQFMQFIAVVYNRGYLTWNAEERSWQYAVNTTELVDALTDGWFGTVSDEFMPLLNVNAMAMNPLRYADLATLHLGDGHHTKNLLDTLIWYSLLIAVDGVVYFSTPAIWRTVRDAMTPAMEAQALTLLIQCTSGVERLRYVISANQHEHVLDASVQLVEDAWQARDVSTLYDILLLLEDMPANDQRMLELRGIVYVYIGGMRASTEETTLYSDSLTVAAFASASHKHAYVLCAAILLRWQGRFRDALWMLQGLVDDDMTTVDVAVQQRLMALICHLHIEVGDLSALQVFATRYAARVDLQLLPWWPSAAHVCAVLSGEADSQPVPEVGALPAEATATQYELHAYWQAWRRFIDVELWQCDEELLHSFMQPHIAESTFSAFAVTLCMVQQVRFGQQAEAERLYGLLHPHMTNDVYLLPWLYLRYVEVALLEWRGEYERALQIVEEALSWIERYDILVMQVIFTGSALRLARLWRQEAQMQHWQRQLLAVHERTAGVVGLRYDHELAWAALAHHKPAEAIQYAQRAIAQAAHHRYGVMLPGDVESMMVALMQQVQSDDQVVGTLLHAQTTLLGYMRQLSTPLQRWEFVNHLPYLRALLQSRWDVHRVHVVWAHPQVSVPAAVPVGVRIPVVVPEVAHLLDVLDRVDMAVVIYRHVHMQGGVLDAAIVQQLCVVSLDEATQLLHRLQTQLGIEIPAPTAG